MARQYEFYWVSNESARQRREYYAKPKPKTWYRFQHPTDGGLETVTRTWVPPTVQQAPGYYTVMCLESGCIFDYTERTKIPDERPDFNDTIFIGSYCFEHTVLLRHKDGLPGKYRIGYGGLHERQLTIEQARYIISICKAKKEPIADIIGFESNQVYHDYFNHACQNQEHIRELLMGSMH